MSYIRCGSNPEGLYVFESGSGLEFWWIDEKNKQRKVICKPSIFKHFMKKMFETDGYVCDRVILRNISIKNVTVNTTNPQKYKIIKREMSTEEMLDGKIKWNTWVCLTINETKILMWPVTWHYFYNSFIKQNFKEKLND